MNSALRTPHSELENSLLAFISRRFLVTAAEIKGPSRVFRIVLPRWLAIEITARETGLPNDELAVLFGLGRTTIDHARAELARIPVQEGRSPLARQITETLVAWAAAKPA